VEGSSFPAIAAVALAASPVAASAAQPLSIANSPELRAGAEMQDESGMRGNTWLWVAGAVVAYLIIAAVADIWPFDDDDPDSP
jgi:hypothetical protein